MHGTLTIARLTWMEARRRRIVHAAVIGGAAYLLLFGLAVTLIVRHAVESNAVLAQAQYFIMTQLGLYVATFLSFAVAILLPVDTLSGEIDSGVMQTLASKPISRSAIVLGKTLTYWLMAVGYLLFMAIGVILIVWFPTGIAPTDLERVLPVIALGVTVLVAVSIAGGTRFKTITNGMIGFAYYGIAFLGGWIEQAGAALGNDAALRVGTAISLISPADAMWRRAAYDMQPDLIRNFPNFGPFASLSVPSAAMIVWTIGVVVVLLLLSLYLFRQRAL